MHRALSPAVIVLAMASGSAAAGVVITSKHTNFATKETSVINGFIEADRLKIVTPPTTVIFRGDLNRAWVIATAASAYVEITPEVVSGFAARLAAAQKAGSPEQQRLQERLAKLPPAQREAAEQQLRAMGAGSQQVSYAKAGSSKTVPAGPCEVYAKTVAGQKQEELCITPISALGFTDADFRALELFAAFMGPVAGSPVAPRADFLNWAEMNRAIGFSGMPLETTVLSGGQPALQDAMQKAERAAIPADAFDLPAGLTKRELAVQR